MIAVIDYKAGNLTSVVKALNYLGAKTEVTQSPDVVRRAQKIVLPGVGHFQATQLLHDLKLTEATRESAAKGTPFLGICVGLQWLYVGSTEAPSTDGLCHFNGRCERFPASWEGAELKSPHVGWNSLEQIRPDSRLLRGISNGSFVYYTHSWRAPVSEDTAAVTNYGGAFTAAVERDNVMGVQFHPEKSSDTGLQLLKNFLEI
ncbi:MAG: imidazole glycerol phosphate synthase subunit HisH [Acidobacteria bacterium]|jgi:glutamine amidotransferase|nr:imidazole glycerol phosphate synthase subunit HisH [Acidobacteriota bacterium]